MFKNLKIQTKITLPIILTVVIVLSAGTIYSYSFNVKSIKTAVGAHLETAVQSRIHHIETVLKMYEQRARMLTSKTWLRKHLKSYLETGEEEYKTKVEEILADVQKENPNFLHISIINPKGQIIISTIKDSVGKDISNKAFFINGKKDYIISDFHQPNPDGSRLHIAGPLIQDGEFLGVVAVASDGKTLENAVAEYAGLGETGEIYLINKEGYMITPSRFREDTFLKTKVETLQANLCIEGHLKTYSNYKGTKVLGIHHFIPKMDWCLLAEIDESEALAATKDLLVFSIIRIFIVLFIFFTVAYLLARTISGPIVALHQGTEIISEGNLGHKVGTDSRDEIGQLSRAFDKMTTAIKKSRAEVDKKVEEQTQEIVEKQEILEDQQKAVLNVLEDVDEEKRNVEEEKDKIDAILHSIGDGVFVVDADLKVTMFNKVAADITGYLPEEVFGKRYDQNLKFVFEKDGKINDSFIKEAMKTGEIKEMSNHTVIITKNGAKVPVSDSAAPLKDKNGEIIGCVVVFRDVTKEREVDRMKTEFVSVASHQLRTPLSAIKWFLEMVLGGDAGEINDEQRDYLDQVFESNQRMIRLVNDLLNVSRIEMGRVIVEPEPTDLLELTQEVIKEMAPQIEEMEQTLIHKGVGKIPQVSFDPQLIRQVVQNILSNASRYTPKEGKIEVKIYVESESIIFSVKDNGYGIPKNQQEKIFTKFFRAENITQTQTDGSGLGLYIGKSAVEASGGRLWFESAGEGKGSTFYFSLPLSGSPAKTGEIRLTRV